VKTRGAFMMCYAASKRETACQGYVENVRTLPEGSAILHYGHWNNEQFLLFVEQERLRVLQRLRILARLQLLRRRLLLHGRINLPMKADTKLSAKKVPEVMFK